MKDMEGEVGRINAAFRGGGGGVVCLPGIPILLGGCEDGTAIRSILESGRWLVHSGTQHLQETQKLLVQEIWANAKGGQFTTEKFRIIPMPLNSAPGSVEAGHLHARPSPSPPILKRKLSSV